MSETPVQLAPMTLGDYDAVVALWRRSEGVAMGESDTPAAIAAYLARNEGLSSVARIDGRVVGAVLCGHDGRRGLLHHLAVEADQRGRGIGRLLVQRSLDNLRAVGIIRCWIAVLGDNADGLAFWTRQGWSNTNNACLLFHDT